MFLDAICAFLPLLPNANDRAIGFNVFVYFDGDGLRYAQPGYQAEEINHPKKLCSRKEGLWTRL